MWLQHSVVSLCHVLFLHGREISLFCLGSVALGDGVKSVCVHVVVLIGDCSCSDPREGGINVGLETHPCWGHSGALKS